MSTVFTMSAVMTFNYIQSQLEIKFANARVSLVLTHIMVSLVRLPSLNDMSLHDKETYFVNLQEHIFPIVPPFCLPPLFCLQVFAVITL